MSIFFQFPGHFIRVTWAAFSLSVPQSSSTYLSTKVSLSDKSFSVKNDAACGFLLTEGGRKAQDKALDVELERLLPDVHRDRLARAARHDDQLQNQLCPTTPFLYPSLPSLRARHTYLCSPMVG